MNLRNVKDLDALYNNIKGEMSGRARREFCNIKDAVTMDIVMRDKEISRLRELLSKGKHFVK